MSKLIGVNQEIEVKHTQLRTFGSLLLQSIGCSIQTADEVSNHLVDADLCGINSHGSMRLSQYITQAELNLWTPSAVPRVHRSTTGAWFVDGQDCLGISAVRVGVRVAAEHALKSDGGIACVGITNCGHTGRIGVFAEEGAKRGCLTFVIGGGSRKSWRQVAPYGGIKGLLPTNPYAISIPGDARGPVTIDFATGATAGGWIMAASKSQATLPLGLFIDSEGTPSSNPNDYINGGAILPAAGSKGFGLGLMAELIGYALLGKVTKETGLGLNTMVIALDTSRFTDASLLMSAATEVLHEVRACPPDTVRGFTRVQVPGQRENDMKDRVGANGIVTLPEGIWEDIVKTARKLGVEGSMPKSVRRRSRL